MGDINHCSNMPRPYPLLALVHRACVGPRALEPSCSARCPLRCGPFSKARMFNVVSATNCLSAGSCANLSQCRVRRSACFVVFFVSEFEGRLSPSLGVPPLAYSFCGGGGRTNRGQPGETVGSLALASTYFCFDMARFVYGFGHISAAPITIRGIYLNNYLFMEVLYALACQRI